MKAGKVAPPTDEDRRTLVRWIDLGCPVDKTFDPENPAKRGSGPGIKPGRGDIVLAAALTIEGVLRAGDFAGIEANEAGLRETLELVTEGRELIEYAAGELDAVGKGLEELKLDDLIARLEAAEPARN